MKNIYIFLQILQPLLNFSKETKLANVLFVVCLLLSTSIYADTESQNNTNTGADTIMINTDVQGQLNNGGGDGVDWFVFYMPEDGLISLSVNATLNGFPGWSWLEMTIDKLDCPGWVISGTSAVSSGGGVSTGILNYPIHTGAGYHLVRLRDLNFGIWNYSFKIIPTYTNVANDTEPNNSYSEANFFQLNSTQYGHLGFRYCGPSDNVDYYKIVIPTAGSLSLTCSLTAINNDPINEPVMQIIDSSNSQVVASTPYSPPYTSSANLALNCIALNQGTYYIKIAPYIFPGLSYILTNEFSTSSPCFPISATSSLNLKLLLHGYYELNGLMRPVLLNQGNSSDSTTTDSIDVELHQSYFPYDMVLSRRSLLALDGNIILNLPYILGNYYIAIKHRNVIQTWSASPISFTSSQVNYDFTIAASKAYGNNMKEVEPGVWAFYSGDINQDENIDLIDLSLLEGDINSFAYGYLATDINGDGNVDLLDLTPIEANINNFIFSNHP